MGDGPPDGVVLEIDPLPQDLGEMAEEMVEDQPILGIEPPEISRGDEPAEDFALGPQHGAFLLAVAVAVWWFFLRKGGSGGHVSQPASNVDKEELRRKRLEALAARASAATSDATSDEGLRKRSTAAPERAEEQGPKTPERPPALVVEAKAAAKQEAPVAAAPEALAAAPESPAADVAAEPAPPASPMEKEAAETPSAPAPPAEEEKPVAPAKEEEQPPSPAAEEPPAPEEPPVPEPPLPSDFSVQLRSTLQGSSRTERLGGFTGDSTVGGLRDLAATTFQTGAEARLRLFFNGKELKSLEATFAALGIAANTTIQVMVSAPVATSSSSGQPGTPKAAVAAAPAAAAPVAAATAAAPAAAGAAATAPAEPAAAAAASEGSSSAPAEAAGPVTLRVQGTLQGATAVHTVEASSSSSIADLEEQILEKFGAAGQRLRLFYMGRELKDREKSVGSVAFKPGAMLQAMFAAGTARASKTRPSAPSSPTAAAEAPAATAAEAPPAPPAAPQVVCGPEGCRLVTPEAPPCGTATPAVASSAPADASTAPAAAAPAANGQAVSPEEAWRAMAGLEEQLSRAVDASEAEDVRQAAQVLKQMLTTMTHGDNPALMQFAQAAVPDLSKIWGFGPTREHLQGLLGAPQPAPATPGNAAAGSAS